MEIFLKCYLDQFASLPRNTLHDRRNRRSVVDYISTLIEGCRSGENCDAQKTTREAIISLIRYHEESRRDNGYVCKMGKFHNILYVAIKLCYDWQLNDTGTVIALLEHIYLCEQTFERIFVGALFGTNAPHFIAGWKSDFNNQEENVRAMVYFIDHATNGGLEMAYDEEESVRFIDVPIESCGKCSATKIAAQLFMPDKLHILLRYGALIDDTVVEHTLNRLIDFFHVYPYNIVACLQLILRVIPAIKLVESSEKITDRYRDLIDDAIVPMTRCGIQAPELKHLCRCVVRKRLWENYQLPNGIRQLPVPESLRKYIDILDD